MTNFLGQPASMMLQGDCLSFPAFSEMVVLNMNIFINSENDVSEGTFLERTRPRRKSQ